jgi:membrane associated rhomboid family serine protease
MLANTAVFLTWKFGMRSPRVGKFMSRHFTESLHSTIKRKRFHTLFTSTFSHVGGLHFFINMYALYNLAPPLSTSPRV